jgi:MoaA/NifB/PqqE/SkfB family radical SAM enzyme
MTLKIDLFRRMFLWGRRPFSVGLLTTFRCNFNCEFCRLPQLGGNEMTPGETIMLLEQFRKVGAKRLGISGGEPLLRENIGTVISAANRMGFWVTVNTNGFLLPEKLDELKDARLIVVSLDGTPEIHDHIRKAGSFERLRKGVQLARARGIDTAAIMVVTSRNLHILRQTVTMGARMGLRMFVQPVTECDLSGRLDEKLKPAPEAFANEVRWLINNAAGLRLGNSRAFLRHLLHYPNWPDRHKCAAGDFFVYINPDGTLTPCHVHFLRDSPSALDLGVEEALKRLTRNACTGCGISPYIEQNLLADFNLGSIRHALRSI